MSTEDPKGILIQAILDVMVSESESDREFILAETMVALGAERLAAYAEGTMAVLHQALQTLVPLVGKVLTRDLLVAAVGAIDDGEFDSYHGIHQVVVERLYPDRTSSS